MVLALANVWGLMAPIGRDHISHSVQEAINPLSDIGAILTL
jgi:hypothetical protein